jgi:tetratricopeptide (TPR) repeat protein
MVREAAMTQPAINQKEILAAVAHHQAGRFAEAEAAYRKLLVQSPNHPELLQLLGAVAGQTGRNEEAAQLISRAIAIYPNNAIYHSNYSEMCRRLGRLDEAISHARRAVELKSDFVGAHANLGSALRDAGRLDEAIASFRRALQINPNFADAMWNLAHTLKDAQQLTEATALFERICQLQPNSAEAWCNLGISLRDQRKFDEAINAFNRSISLNPKFAPAYNNLGVAYSESDQLDQATQFFRKAIEVQPDYAHAWKNLAVALGEHCKYDECLAAFAKAAENNPELPEIYSNRAIILLTLGDYEQGWKDYEWRWRANLKILAPPRKLAEPRWDGSPIDGRTILLHTEQGFGDAIQFARYIPLVAERGGRVILECQPELVRLLRTVPGVDRIITRGDPLPRFDVHSPLMTLPLVFNTTLETIPSRFPYLTADPTMCAKWKNRFDAIRAKLRIGITWAGSTKHRLDRERSMTTADLAPISQVSDVAFFSLQKGDPSRQKPPAVLNWFDFTSELNDFADTAALVANLDLIISVDTAVVHLAGALAKPTWVLLPHPPDWRWLLNRTDSPWYPTVRVFRQSVRRDWLFVIRAVVAELTRQISESVASP